MDSDERLEALVEPLRDDVVSGAAVVARTAADVMRRAAVRTSAGSLEELRWSLGDVAKRVLDAQPAMAPLVQLVREVLASVEVAESLEEGRLAAANAAEEFRDAIETHAQAVAAEAAGVLPAEGLVATISSSSSVESALLHGDAAGARRVLCFESRPVNEGRKLAEALAGAGVEVTYAVDAAVHSLVPDCDAVLFGADSIGDAGVVNKIGSTALAQAAASARVPVYVLSDATKILPRGFPQSIEDDRPGEEVWDGPPEGVRVWNRYFEVVSLGHVSGVVTESGVLTPAELEEMRAGLEFPDVLRRWAERRPGPTSSRTR